MNEQGRRRYGLLEIRHCGRAITVLLASSSSFPHLKKQLENCLVMMAIRGPLFLRSSPTAFPQARVPLPLMATAFTPGVRRRYSLVVAPDRDSFLSQWAVPSGLLLSFPD